MTSVNGKGSSGQFLLLLLNARFILRKIKYIRLFVLLSNLDFILVNETWLNDHTLGNTTAISG